MKIDTSYFGPPQGAAEAARLAHQAGISGLWIPETGHDPFLSILLASQAAPELEVGTGIAVGFARSPMTLAQTSWDLSGLTQGKFFLGLGSQVKAHITRRFSMPWASPPTGDGRSQDRQGGHGSPVDQMRELIAALRTIWKCFDTGEKLSFAGQYYQLSLLTPFFTPARHEHPCIPVGLAAVGPKMTELAGETADFLAGHWFTNVTYLKEVTIPALEAGLAKAGRSRSALCLSGASFVITGDAEGKRATEVAARRQVAFYGSTPAYAPVLEIIGHGDLAVALHKLSREGKWEEMARLIPNDVLEHFAVRAEVKEVKAALEERFAGLYDRMTVSLASDQLKWLVD